MALPAASDRCLAAVVVLAAGVLLFPITALGESGASATATQSAIAPTCRAANTEVWMALESNGTAGTVYYYLEFSNIGHQTCTLFGYPGVSAVNQRGNEVGNPAAHFGTRSLVTLQRGVTAHAILGVLDAGASCDNHGVMAAALRVYPPGQTVIQLVDLSVSVCSHQSSMRIFSMRSGTGIPYYTYP
ncbi:MAG TPA: DUF4232 domain-containing protein [Acidimicrobiales bacterium]